MHRDQRLRRRQDFTAVYSRGRAWSNQHVAVRVLPRSDGGPGSRIGFSVNKRVGNAVIRNRVKRRLRAILGGLPVRAGLDVVVVARPLTATAAFQELSASLHSILNRAKVLEQARQSTRRGEGSE